MRLRTVLLAGTLLAHACASWMHGAQVGQKAADFRLQDSSGRAHSLESYLSSGNTVVVCFWSFKCPVSLAYNDRLAALQEKYRSRGVVVLALASNANESSAEIGRNAANLGLPFPILIDKDGTVADKLGATHSPHVFVIDRSGAVRYRGALDNNKRAGESGRVAFAEEALEAVLSSRPVSQPETKVLGCTIKRKSF